MGSQGPKWPETAPPRISGTAPKGATPTIYLSSTGRLRASNDSRSQLGEGVRGWKVRVQWAEGVWYMGTVTMFDEATQKHLVGFDDSDSGWCTVRRRIEPSVRRSLSRSLTLALLGDRAAHRYHLEHEHASGLLEWLEPQYDGFGRWWRAMAPDPAQISRKRAAAEPPHGQPRRAAADPAHGRRHRAHLPAHLPGDGVLGHRRWQWVLKLFALGEHAAVPHACTLQNCYKTACAVSRVG